MSSRVLARPTSSPTSQPVVLAPRPSPPRPASSPSVEPPATIAARIAQLRAAVRAASARSPRRRGSARAKPPDRTRAAADLQPVIERARPFDRRNRRPPPAPARRGRSRSRPASLSLSRAASSAANSPSIPRLSTASSCGALEKLRARKSPASGCTPRTPPLVTACLRQNSAARPASKSIPDPVARSPAP